MNDLRILFFVFIALFGLVSCIILVGNFLAKRFTEDWLFGATVIFLLLALTCFSSAQTRVREDRQKRNLEHEKLMEEIQKGFNL